MLTPTPTQRKAADWLYDVQRARGFAIILVVLGHIVARQPPAGNEWYSLLQFVIYSFHMPFFMYLAGLVFTYSGKALHSWQHYWEYLVQRAIRLLVPFLLFGLAIVTGKLLLANTVYVDNAPVSFVGGLLSLIWNTSASPVRSIWFLFVLFVYCMITPPLLGTMKWRLWPLSVFAAAAYLITFPDYFYLNQIGHFYLFFVIGMVMGLHLRTIMPIVDRHFSIFGLLFVGALTIVAIGEQHPILLTVSSLLSIPALHGLMRRAPLDRSEFLFWIGRYSFAVYLLNTVFIGLTKAVLLKFMTWDGLNFLVFFPALVVTGLFCPVALAHVGTERAGIFGRIAS
jgi:fucose 4-O-acetylase-like acetyltransferase